MSESPPPPIKGINVCPACERRTVAVIDTRLRDGGRVRLRQCQKCSHRWATIEKPLVEKPWEVKK